GRANGRRGPRDPSSVSSGRGRIPTTRQWASSSHTLATARLNEPVASATATAITPPAIAEYNATNSAALGPSQAPMQAASFTSPAPMPPSRNIGRTSASPTVQPPTLAASPPRLEIHAEYATASAAPPKVSRLG